MKKIISTTVAMSLVLLASPTYAANELDLDSLDAFMDEDITSTDTTSASDITISNIDVMFQDGSSIPAGGTESMLVVKVTDDTGANLDDTSVMLEVEAIMDSSDDAGEIGAITYNNEGEYFEVPYTTSNTEGAVFFTIKATAIDDPSVILESGEEILVVAPVEQPTTPEEDTVVDETSEDVSTDLDALTEETTDTMEEENIIPTEESEGGEEVQDADENVEISANVLSTKIIGENRIVVNFDRELFLPDEPISLVSVTKADDQSEVNVANVTLGDDKKSLVILTTESLGTDQYRLAINEVVDGETKKRINVVNGELTVTGLSEVFAILLALGLLGGVSLVRKQKEK